MRIILSLLFVTSFYAVENQPTVSTYENTRNHLSLLLNGAKTVDDAYEKVNAWVINIDNRNYIGMLIVDGAILSRQIQTRWETDTKVLAEELKSATKALAKESMERVRLENMVAALQQEIAELKKSGNK